MNISGKIYKKKVSNVMTKTEQSLLQNNPNQVSMKIKKIGRFAAGLVAFAMIAYLIAYLTMFIINNGQFSFESFSSSFAGIGIVGALMYIFGKLRSKCDSVYKESMIVIEETVLSYEPEETGLANCG